MSGMRNETKLYIAIQPHINLHIKINIIVTFWHNISKLFRSLTSLYLRLSSPSRVYIPAVTFWRLRIVKTNNFQRMNWTRRISVFALFHLIRSLLWRWEAREWARETQHHGPSHLTINYKYTAPRWIVNARWSIFYCASRRFEWTCWKSLVFIVFSADLTLPADD